MFKAVGFTEAEAKTLIVTARNRGYRLSVTASDIPHQIYCRGFNRKSTNAPLASVILGMKRTDAFTACRSLQPVETAPHLG